MNADQAGRASQEELTKRLVAYYFGNWYRDFNKDGIADLMLFDRAQDSLALGGLPEVSISYAIVTPDASAPEAPVIADSQFEDGELRLRLNLESSDGGSSNGEGLIYSLTCTDGINRYQTTSQTGQLVLSGLDDESRFQCSVRARNDAGSYSEAVFTADAIISESADAPTGLPIWLLYEATKGVSTRAKN